MAAGRAACAGSPSGWRRDGALAVGGVRSPVGRLSANPISTVGFERRHNRAMQFDSEAAFVDALTRDIPPAPEQRAVIVAANALLGVNQGSRGP
jgi:hypothetical protein